MSELASSPRTNMWVMLARTIIENIESSQLDSILVVVKKNLTFDDPGLFSPKFLENQEERDREETANTWFINQLVYSISITDSPKSIQNNVGLQKEILSASIVKQSLFFRKIVECYLEFTNALLSSEENAEIEAFVADSSYPMSQIDSGCTFRKIKITDSKRRQKLLESSLQMLTHAMNLGLDLYEEMFGRCTDCILKVFNAAALASKLICLEYVTRLLYHKAELDPDTMHSVLIIVQGATIVFEKIPVWLQTESVARAEVVRFSNYLGKLFKALCPYRPDRSTVDFLENLIRSQVKILQILSSEMFERLELGCDDLQTIVVKSLEIYLTRTEVPVDLSAIRQLEDSLIVLPESLSVLEFVVLDNIRSSKAPPNAIELSATWRAKYSQLLSSLGFLNSHHNEFSNDYSSHLKLVSEVMKAMSSLSLNYTRYHQTTHIADQSNCFICQAAPSNASDCTYLERYSMKAVNMIFFPNDQPTEILRKFVDNSLIRTTISIDDYCTLVEFASSLLKNRIASDLTSRHQIRLMDFIAQTLKTNYDLNLRTQPIEINDLTDESLDSVQLKCLSLLLNSDLVYLTLEATEYLKCILKKVLGRMQDDRTRTIVLSSLVHLIVNNILPSQLLFAVVISPVLALATSNPEFYKTFKSIVCLWDGQACAYKKIENGFYIYSVICQKCDTVKKCICPEKLQDAAFHLNVLKETRSALVPTNQTPNHTIRKSSVNCLFDPLLLTEKIPADLINCLPTFLIHIEQNTNWIELFANKDIDTRSVFSDRISNIVKIALENSPESVESILDRCIQKLLVSVKDSLDASDQPTQSSVVDMILKFAIVEGIPQKTLLRLFRMTFLFFIRYESCVSHEAALCAAEMCSRNCVTPRNLLNWYKQDILKLIITLCVSIYLINGIGLNKALSNITKMLGFSGPRDFIAKHYKLVIAMLLPWSIKHPKCESLLEEVSATIQKDLATALTESFLTIYPYLFLNESTEINNKCIDYVIQHTESSLYQLLQSDIKRTVAEILIYYHKNPTNVMQAFRCLLLKDMQSADSVDVPHSKVTEYIATRFLGVLTFFEACLIDPDFEKSLKQETMLSLGEIMRFIGPTHISPFRFKILAMLRTALNIDDSDLGSICAKVWNIFIHTVDVQALGPLLSTIVASLQPLLATNPEEVNSIYRFLILSNGSLLSQHIPDLYFMENMNVAEEIKVFVKQSTKTRRGESFMDQFKFFLMQIGHENPTVRVYGLNYLTKLFEKNRISLNNLIIEQNALNGNTILDKVLVNLMVGCRHDDKNLQLASSKCLGELGAIEPSHLPPNYAPQRNFALSIQTDAFAIMALKELCRAYQFQKDTKYVDSFSLAIQEILLNRGVCPKRKKKMEVWEAIPERMRQLMEPLLTSCYTALKINTSHKVHPVFGSSKCQTAEEWAFIWASKMIVNVQDESTRHLLDSLKPSIKRDAITLGLFLPYIILHALQSSSSDESEQIYEELKCVLEAAENRKNVNNIELNKTRMRGLKTLQFAATSNGRKPDESTEYIGIKCAKIAFEQLDFFEQWMREWRSVYIGHTPDSSFIQIESFVKRFEKKLVAKANFNCGEYARALMYLESYIEENPTELLQDNLSFLAEIYAELKDPDSLEGAISLKKAELTLSEEILVNNMTDRLLESTACFEQLMQVGDIQPIHVRDIVECYLRLDTPETALLVSEGLLNQLGERYINDCLKEIQAEPLWRLGRFEELEKLLDVPKIGESNSWGVQCGQALLQFRKPDVTRFDEQIEKIRLNVLQLLKTGGVEQNPYHKGYPQVMTLHLISEIEKTKTLANKLITNSSEVDCQRLLETFFKEWQCRLALLQPTPRVTEPVLCLRRILLTETKELLRQSNSSASGSVLTKIDEEIGKMWIRSTELARTAGMFQQAQLCIMNATKYQPPNLFIEKAKLLWMKGDQTNCFKVIERKIQEILQLVGPSQSIQSLDRRTRLLYAEAKFLQATYNAESMNISTDKNLKYFRESIEGNQRSEKCLVRMAQYQEKIYNSMSEDEQKKSHQHLYEIMRDYGCSMSFGCEFIYQSMPRMLSIWLDFTAQAKLDEPARRTATNMNAIVEKLSGELPLFVFFTAFSQLVSRICHPSSEVYTVLQTIIVRLIQQFTQQSLWMILSVFKSSYTSRVKRCTQIFNDKRLAKPEMQKLITDFNSLAEKLIELTNKEIPMKEKAPCVSMLVRQLPRIFADPNFSKIIMPLQQFTQPILPPIDERSHPADKFDAFPNKCIYMCGIKEEMEILQSLQKPRKVVISGSNGKNYTFMLKPKDDLRKDFRLMEFNAMVKQYFHQDPDARHRRLSIRTYAVLPLNEECGLIEWVDNLHPFRHITSGIYKQRNLGMSSRELRLAACAATDSAAQKRDTFLNVLVRRHPPVFAEWFRRRFTTPHNWYQARSSYIRTLAVMSIVGYILGLGDRHGENILFDDTNGDAVHVDFNCLFNKGETFEYPEKVPFRLTQNMVHAMGPLGIEGLYKKCCEIAMRVLQAQKLTLMSVLRPFVYDPLVSWTRHFRTDNKELTDDKAMANIKRIEQRLNGFVEIKGRTSNMPLSTEGQVNFVISEAMDIDNLAAMYIGWGSYL